MRKMSMITALLLVAPLFAFAGGSPSFEDGNEEAVASLSGPGFESMINIGVPAGYYVTNATVKVTGMAAENNASAYPEGVTMKLNDGVIWAFQQNGFGPMGRQNQFSAGQKQVNSSFGANGGVKTEYIRLRKDATVQSATMVIRGFPPTTGQELVNFTGNTADDHLGFSVSNAGDVNNDGYDDVIVGHHMTTWAAPMQVKQIYITAVRLSRNPTISVYGPGRGEGPARLRVTVMKLDRADAELFHALYHPMLCFANRELGVVKGIDSTADVKRASLADLGRIRDAMCDRPELIDRFARKNPFGLSPEKLGIVSGLKGFVRGTFIVMRYVDNGAVMLSPEEKPVRAYGVQSLFSPFEVMLGPVLPAMIDAVLVPFCGGITYDGIVHRQNVSFGAGMRSSFEDALRDAKSRFGVIMSLPFSAEKSRKSDAERLRSCLKSEHSRLMHSSEIRELRLKDRALDVLYHQEMGRVHSRAIGKRARQVGLAGGWFAVLEGLTVAAAATKEDVERVVERIVPAGKKELVHIFRLKGR